MARILIGTCSWTDPGLIAAGTFYPPGVTSAEGRLRYYASAFPLVEVDSSYYSLPAARNALLWAERTPEGFTFDVKAFRLFTNHPTPAAALPREVAGSWKPPAEKPNLYLRDVPPEAQDDLWGRFTGALEPLRGAGKLGVVVLQYPPWVGPGREAEALIRTGRAHLEEFQVAVEFRNAVWFREGRAARTFSFLEDQGLGFVAVDEPQGFRSSVPPVVGVTGPVAVVRFHGRSRETWERRNATPAERFNYSYRDDEFAAWVPRIREMAEQAQEVHLLMNTNHADQGPVNARRLAAALQQAHVL